MLKNVSVGKYCSIANNVMIGIGQHPTNLVSTNSIFYKNGINDKFATHINYEEEPKTVIGNDVWFGNGALIMEGVHIGDGTIIAARAVVTKSTPPYSIVGGVPAKIIKYRFSEDVIAALLKTKWWTLSDEQIMKILPLFTKENVSKKDIEMYFGKIGNKNFAN